jgi:hypothetical protein
VTDWGRVLAEEGEVPQEQGDAAVISNWLAKSDQCAFTGIVTRVNTSSTDELDRLDSPLLSLATTNGSPDVRLRLIKFYAIFKSRRCSATGNSVASRSRRGGALTATGTGRRGNCARRP